METLNFRVYMVEMRPTKASEQRNNAGLYVVSRIYWDWDTLELGRSGGVDQSGDLL